jgi:hypothetical protein
MSHFLHKPIKRFHIEGEIGDDSAFPRLRNEYINLLNTKMRIEGYVPRIDIDPEFSLSYNGKSYEFVLSVYGSYVGKKKAEWIIGLDGNRAISSQKIKSGTSYKTPG